MKNAIESLHFRLARHHDRERVEILDVPTQACPASVDFAGARWRLDLGWADKGEGRKVATFTATVIEGNASGVSAGLVWKLDDWSVENYVLIPGAVYAGNRFDAMRRPYSPKIRDIGQRGDRLLLDIGDIPRLTKGEGRSHLDQTSLDAAVPGVGIRFAHSGEALMLLMPQNASHGPIGIELSENDARDRAELMLLAPGFLHPLPADTDPMLGIGNQAAGHRHPENARPADVGQGESISFAFEQHVFPCADVHGLFERFFAHRTAMFPESATAKPEVLPFSAAWDLLERKHNEQNWKESHGLYAIGIPWVEDQATQFWQNGWVGGGITTFAMMQEGGPMSVERAIRNLDFLLTEGVSDLGLFKATMSESGEWKGDRKVGGDEAWCREENQGEEIPKDPSLCLVRRQGDCLLFVLRQLMLLSERGHAVPERWNAATRGAAEAICDVWAWEGEFGFLLDTETGRIAIRGSTSGALIPGALALASQYFSEPRFLEVARESGEFFRSHDLAWGVTTGGPGDALQAPDGESIFGLIESFISLFELTGDAIWRVAAVRACHQGASWAISYPYQFPPNSALAQIGCDARGTMIANAQNKCGVPGICTLSGQGILRTFRATGDVRLLDLLCDIAHALPQFLSREDRKIPTRITWGHPFAELPTGWMCERVNITPSWAEPLGEQAAYSCWCEVAMMLTWCDLPGVYAQPDTGLIRSLDHVRAAWADEGRTALRLHNPTAFPARVRVQLETSAMAATKVLHANYAALLPSVEVPPGGTFVWAV
ncbi:MAG: hypothetical protein JJU29_01380 [Verrucomicrobia bacterium]|nr:hypothetical protein [Verrucomicrobiota bacterium]MCH8511974.1 hypothetical protein [Kiritimatiellia bacterium]